jgi:hypothetical protein
MAVFHQDLPSGRMAPINFFMGGWQLQYICKQSGQNKLLIYENSWIYDNTKCSNE